MRLVVVISCQREKPEMGMGMGVEIGLQRLYNSTTSMLIMISCAIIDYIIHFKVRLMYM